MSGNVFQWICILGFILPLAVAFWACMFGLIASAWRGR